MTNVEIKNMVIRIPGISTQYADDIGIQVALELERQLVSLPSIRKLDEVDIKIQSVQNQTPEQLAKAIVQTIVNRIRYRGNVNE